jgi:hypothetical protein
MELENIMFREVSQAQKVKGRGANTETLKWQRLSWEGDQ